MEPANWTPTEEPNQGRLVLNKSLRINDAVELQQRLLEGLERFDLLELDLSGVDSLGLSCFQLIYAFARDAERRGKHLRLSAEPSASVAKVLELTGTSPDDLQVRPPSKETS